MSCMKLGSKADVFHLQGQSWLCANGLPSDVRVEVGEASFHLHKFPLLSRSQLLEKLIQDHSISHKSKDETECVLSLHNLPGGAETFLLIAKFCYGVKFELTAADVVGLRCAAEHLQMNEDYGEGNLISKTEVFLDEVLRSWVDTLTALKTCEEPLPLAEELHIISRCIDFLATKAFSEPTLSRHMPGQSTIWNGIPSTSKSCLKTDAWWYKDVAILKLPLFKRLILAIGSKGMASDRISRALMFYANCYLPLNCRRSSFRQINPGSAIPVLSDAEQRMRTDEIIALLPDQKGAAPTNFLFQLLWTSMILHASTSSREILERRIVAQLDQAVLEDLLILHAGYSMETFYAMECVERMFNNFSFVDPNSAGSDLKSVEGDGRSGESSHSVMPTTMVANLLDDYLAEIASYLNLKLEQFMSLAGSIPDFARPLDDGLYRAIDIYLKAHSLLTDSERERLCKLINCKKLSEEASKHAAENEGLPMRFVLEVLFFDQHRIQKSISRRSVASNNPKNSRNSSGKMAGKNNPTVPSEDILKLNDMRECVLKLEKNCEKMKQEMGKKKKPVKTKGGWSSFCKGVGLSCKPKSGNHQEKDVIDGKKDHQNK